MWISSVEELRDALEEARIAQGRSTRDVSKAAGLTVPSYWCWTQSPTSWEAGFRYAKALGVEVAVAVNADLHKEDSDD